MSSVNPSFSAVLLVKDDERRLKFFAFSWTDDLMGLAFKDPEGYSYYLYPPYEEGYVIAVNTDPYEFILEPVDERTAPLSWLRYKISRPVPGVTPAITYHTPVNF